MELIGDVKDSASSKALPAVKNYADIPLSSTTPTPQQDVASETSPGETTKATAQPSTGGGVTGFIRSWIGGSKEPTADQTSQQSTTSAATVPTPEPEVTHTTNLKSGTTAQVATAPDHSAVPESLQKEPSPVGTATTSFNEPVSEFAPALTSIAGEPAPSDPTRRYGPALGALTGDEPVASPTASTGVVSSVTTAATSVVASTVETIKHAVGLDQSTAGAAPGTAAESGQPHTGTGLVDTSSPGLITPTDLPKTARVNPQEDGSIDITRGQATSLAAREADAHHGTSPSTNGSALTAQDLPKSGTVNTSADGTADVEPAVRPGLIATAVGTIAGGAGFVKDSVVGLVGGGQAGDTSELIAAMESKEASAPSAVGYESASTEPQSQSATRSTGPIGYESAPVGYESAPVGYESAPVGYESADAGPITQSTTRNEAGPVEFEDSESPQKPHSAAKSSILYEDDAPTAGSNTGPSNTSSAAPVAALGSATSPSTGTSKTGTPTTTPSGPTVGTSGPTAGIPISSGGTAALSGTAPTSGTSQTPQGTGSATVLAPGTTARSAGSSNAVSSGPAAGLAGSAATATGAGKQSQIEEPSATKTAAKTVDEPAAASNVKEVGPSADNGVVEKTGKTGKANIRLPTGEVVEGTTPEKPATNTSTNAKPGLETDSNRPVASAFASPSKPASDANTTKPSVESPAKAATTTDGTTSATKAPATSASTAAGSTTAAQPAATKEITSGEGKATTPSGATAAAEPAKAATTGVKADKQAAAVETTPPKSSFAGAAKDNAKAKKDAEGKKGCCGCVIS